MDCRRSPRPCNVLSMANKIASSIDHPTFISVSQIDVNFFEYIMQQVSDFTTNNVKQNFDRFDRILVFVSDLSGCSLSHISAMDLCNLDLHAIYNLLEIMAFLVDNIVSPLCDGDHPDGSCNSDTNETTSCTDQDDLFQSSVLSKSGECQLPNECDSNINLNSKFPRESDLAKLDPVLLNRKLYLVEKLKQCLVNPKYSNLCPKFEQLSVITGPAIARVQDEQNHFSSSSGYIKQCLRPITPHTYRRSKRFCPSSTETNKLDRVHLKKNNTVEQLFDRVLSEFPALNISERCRHILRKKLINLVSDHPLNVKPPPAEIISDKFDRHLTWIEERQQRRLEQLRRHDRQLDRLREQRACEVIDRRVREEARERKHQLVRCKKYYLEFVNQFRARKLARIYTEEEVFRHFFESFLQQRKNDILGLQKLEQEERQLKNLEKEKEFEALENAHRVRIDMMNENLNKEREARVSSIRQQKLEILQRKRNLRRALELSIREMQSAILNNQDNTYFRSMDAKRLLNSTKDWVF